MRFRKHMQLAQVRPGSAVLDIAHATAISASTCARREVSGTRHRPEFAAPDILIHDITSGLPFRMRPSTTSSWSRSSNTRRPRTVRRARSIEFSDPGVWMVSVPNPHHVKEIHLESLRGPGQAEAHLQLDAPDESAAWRDERVSPGGLGRHVLLSTDSRALVDARAVGRLQVRED